MGKVVKEISRETLLSKMMMYCSRREVCKSEAIQKMKLLEGKREDRNFVLEYLQKENYINHLRYAKAFTHDKILLQLWSKRRVSWELQGKGLSSSEIEQGLRSLSEKEYQDALSQLLHKKNELVQNKKWEERKQYLKEYALKKGFDINQILIALQTLPH